MTLVITRILNNSSAIASDLNHHEYLVMGKGIAFDKEQYDEIDEAKATRVILLNNENKSKLETLVAEIPYEYFSVSEKIKLNTEMKLKTILDDDILIKLTDHIYNAVLRSERGIKTSNLILNEIKTFYFLEYEASLEAIDIVNKELKTNFDENEAGFITFHIVNAESSVGAIDLNATVEFISDVTGKIKEYFHIDLDKNPMAYSRLVTHLKYFSVSLFSKNSMNSITDEDSSLYLALKSKYTDIDSFLNMLSDYIDEKYKYKLTNQDKMYLLIHLARILKKP